MNLATIALRMQKSSKYSSLRSTLFFFRRNVLFFLILWPFLFRACSSLPTDHRDKFYQPNSVVEIYSTLVGSRILSIIALSLTTIPITYLYVIRKEKQMIKPTFSFFLFAILFFLFSTILMDTVTKSYLRWRYPDDANHILTPIEFNNKIVKLEAVNLVSFDSNKNGIADTIKLYMTLNGRDNENSSPGGLFAFGGVNLCLKSEIGLQTITCKHFFHAENQDQLGQDRLRVGSGRQTFLFSLEIPQNIYLGSYIGAKKLRVTAFFMGADNPLLDYNIVIPNDIKVESFEKIGIQKLRNEHGLH